MLDLPFARRRPERLSGRSGRLPFTLDREIGQKLADLGRQQGATLFQTLLALFQLLLYGVSGSTDVVVGSPVAGRSRPETEGLVGCFINALALRARFTDDPTFVDLLVAVPEYLARRLRAPGSTL